jgi:hypothetical protein
MQRRINGKRRRKPVLQGTFTAGDLLNLLQTMSVSQQEAMKAFARNWRPRLRIPNLQRRSANWLWPRSRNAIGAGQAE